MVQQDALTIWQAHLAPFFMYYQQHTRGEDKNLLPIVNKYFSMPLCLQLSRNIWHLTPLYHFALSTSHGRHSKLRIYGHCAGPCSNKHNSGVPWCIRMLMKSCGNDFE